APLSLEHPRRLHDAVPDGAYRQASRRLSDSTPAALRSPSHFDTIAVVKLLPVTLVAERPMSSKCSTPSTRTRPAAGSLKCGDCERGAGHAGDSFRSEHEQADHEHLLPE